MGIGLRNGFAVIWFGDESDLQGVTAPCDVSTPVVGAPNSSAGGILRGVHPNPFNPRTTVTFELPVRSPVVLTIHDVLGRHVATLLDEVRDPGLHQIVWSGESERGERISSGVYYLRLEAASEVSVRKLSLVR